MECESISKFQSDGTKPPLARLLTIVSASTFQWRRVTSRLPPLPADKKTIMYPQSYDVDLEDETHLVPIKDLAAEYGNSRSQASNIGG